MKRTVLFVAAGALVFAGDCVQVDLQRPEVELIRKQKIFPQNHKDRNSAAITRLAESEISSFDDIATG